jgi:ribonucleoside-diphosphate reductase alpha chain
MTVNTNSKGIQIFTQEEALKKSTEYFKGNTLAAEVFVTKYALKDENLEYVEVTPDQMHRRIAREFARVEKKFPNPIPEEEIFELLDQFKYLIPGGSPMFGIGNPYQKISLSNCFVIKTVDSYGGICKADERIAQISKRRGGCVEENSNVYIEGRGLIKIKDVDIGDKILSYNKENRESEFKKVLDKYYTDVKKQNQIKIKLSNGHILRTSVTHPVIVFDGEYYIDKKAGLLKKGDICVVPESESVLKFNPSTISKRMEEIGWFIGAHTGDGTLGFIKDYQQEKYERVYYERVYKGNKRLRIRILGNNEEVVKKYTNICNSLVGSNSKYSRSTRKSYKSVCWQYTSNSSKLFKVAQKYFDNKVGKKTYDCPVFSFVRDNDLWMPYIAGLIDTDGHIRSDTGHIDIAICAKQVIDEISSFLSAHGFKIHVVTRKPKRKNEKQLYRLTINDQEFSKIIIQYLCHDEKIQQLEKHLDNRFYSRVFSFSDQEKVDVLLNYKRIKYTANQNLTLKERSNRSAIVSLLKKRSELGQGEIIALRNFKLISENKSKEIMQRYRIVGLEKEKEDLKYIDIEVEDNNNYYAGNYGLINIHNCGLDISPIRPRGVATRNSAFTTDGITVFMERFSNTSREVAQSGRRGALMLTISVHHPEIINFINIKRDLKKVTGANISVRVSDEFMEAVKKDKKYELRWPIDSSEPKISSKIRARDVWDELVRSNYLSGEPGILFWDNIIRNSPADCYSDLGFETLATNPCGELPICEAGSCILMAMNLSSYVDNPFTDKAKLNQSKFKKHVRVCQKLMDDLVELEIEAIKGIIHKVESDPEDSETKSNELSLWKLVLDKCERGRRTGLGITALGDFIAMLNVKYGSDESLEIIDNVYNILRNEAYKSSIEMSKERGSFPIFDYTKERGNEYLGRLPANIRADMNKHGRRNIGCLTTAPVGSGSTVSKILDLFGTTSGFEPAFKLEYKRKRKLGDTDKDKPDFVDEMGDKWKEYIITHSGVEMFKKISGKPVEESPYFGSQAEDIEYSKRVKMQAIATQYVDHAISATINLPAETDIDTVSNIYLSAWGLGCKGLTIYRSGTRDGVLVDVNNTRECQDCDEASKNLVSLIEGGRRPVNIIQASAPKRPEILECDIHRSKVGGKDWIFFVGKLSGHPYEVFGGDSQEFTIPHKYKSGWICKNGKIEGVTQYNLILGSVEDQNEKLEFKGIAKHFNNYEYGAFTRLTSLTMRHGAPIKYICEQITKKGVEGDLFSFQRALARILKKYISEGEKSEAECPMCHSKDVYYKNGCPTCKLCGHSNCA